MKNKSEFRNLSERLQQVITLKKKLKEVHINSRGIIENAGIIKMNKILNEFVVNTTEYNGIIEYDEKYKLHVVLRNNKNLDCSIRVIKK